MLPAHCCSCETHLGVELHPAVGGASACPALGISDRNSSTETAAWKLECVREYFGPACPAGVHFSRGWSCSCILCDRVGCRCSCTMLNRNKWHGPLGSMHLQHLSMWRCMQRRRTSSRSPSLQHLAAMYVETLQHDGLWVCISRGLWGAAFSFILYLLVCAARAHISLGRRQRPKAHG